MYQKCSWGSGSMLPGDASIHHGWTLHSANAVPPSGPLRLAWALSFVADGARVRSNAKCSGGDGRDEDAVSYEGWIDELEDDKVDHPMVPLLPEVDWKKVRSLSGWVHSMNSWALYCCLFCRQRCELWTSIFACTLQQIPISSAGGNRV